MTTLQASPDRRFVGLSCYTSNLACYLAAEFAGAGAHLAGSVRLAVRTDLPDGRLAFSHHRYPLDRLPDGSRLRYACTADPAEAIAEVRAELARCGRALVVTDNANVPWSPSYRAGAAAPHLLLVTGQREGAWHVADAFGGLLPAGEQTPFAGWLSTEALLGAMTPSGPWTAEQHDRNELAFGFPVAVPRGGPLRWLCRDAGSAAHADLPGDWLVGDDRVLPFIAAYVVDHGAAAERHLDDIWTAAMHRVFRHRWRREAAGPSADDHERLETAAGAWERLPRALRFAVDSARRGKPRHSLVHTTFSHLLEQELALTSPHSPPADTAGHLTNLTSPRKEAR